jgi:hypothetical protein
MATLTLNRPTTRKVNKIIQKKLKENPNLDIDILDVENGQKEIDNQLKLKIKEFWYEIISNIPNSAKNLRFVIRLDRKLKKFFIHFIQDANGPVISILKKHLASAKKNGSSIEYVKYKDVDSSSIFGSGFMTMKKYAKTNLIFKSNPIGEPAYQIDFLTGKYTELTEPMIGGVEIIAEVDFNSAYNSYKNVVESLVDIIRERDSKNITENDRKYLLDVSGFETGTDNNELSNNGNPIEGIQIIYQEDGGIQSTTPKFGGLLDDTGKLVNSIVVNAGSQMDKQIGVTLSDIKVGKVTAEVLAQLPGNLRGAPLLIAYYKNSKQVAFWIRLRAGSGQESINNVLVTCEVERSEIANFFGDTAKLQGVSDNITKVIYDVIKTKYIFNNYPDTKILEKTYQLAIIQLLQEQSDMGDKLRKQSGLTELTKMKIWEKSPQEIASIITDESMAGSDRYDVRVYHIWETGGKRIETKTPFTCFEVKKKSFVKGDRAQLFTYSIKNELFVHGIAISNLITLNAVKEFNSEVAEIKSANRIKGDCKFTMLDLNSYDFNTERTQVWFKSLAKDLLK